MGVGGLSGAESGCQVADAVERFSMHMTFAVGTHVTHSRCVTPDIYIYVYDFEFMSINDSASLFRNKTRFYCHARACSVARTVPSAS